MTKNKILDYCCRGCNASKTCFALKFHESNPCEERQELSNMLDELIDSAPSDVNNNLKFLSDLEMGFREGKNSQSREIQDWKQSTKGEGDETI